MSDARGMPRNSPGDSNPKGVVELEDDGGSRGPGLAVAVADCARAAEPSG